MSDHMVTVLQDTTCIHTKWHNDIVKGLQKALSSRSSLQLLENLDSISIESLSDPVVLIRFSKDNLVPTIQKLQEYQKRIILVGLDANIVSADNISCVTHSRSRQTVKLIQYLRACGKEHTALVGMGVHSINDMVKVNASLTMPNSGITAKDVFSWKHSAIESVQAFLPQAGEYDSVICTNDYIALRLMRALQQQGISVPDDIFIASFSDCMISRFCTPGITSIALDYYDQGRYAYILWQQLQSLPEPGLVSRIVLPGKLIIRGSTAFMPEHTDRAPVIVKDSGEEDLFFSDESLQDIMLIDNCLSRHDALDMQIIEKITAGEGYEQISDECYISLHTLRYRLNKIFNDCNCANKKEFISLLEKAYGSFHVQE